MSSNKKIVIIGAGISGLTTAYLLFKEGYDVIVLEQKDKVGGSIETVLADGFLFDRGPNSGLETTPLISLLAEKTGIRDKMIYANERSSKRYILRNNDLHELPTNPKSFLKTNLFSAKGKFRLFAEPFISKSEDGYYQSIANFVRRRLGKEFLDYAIDPFVSGVFAGNPEELSVKSAFPKLYRLEEIYGGLFKGMIKGRKERRERGEDSKQNARMFSFHDGMQSFPNALASKMTEHISFNAEVSRILVKGNKYEIIYKSEEKDHSLETDVIISTLPAYVTDKILQNMDGDLFKHLHTIYYPPVMVLYLGYEKSKIRRPLDGFGFLIPSKEKKTFLGAIWSSVIFDNRADDDKAAFTLFIGGARASGLFDMNENKLIEKVINEFRDIMKISSEPILLKKRLWNKAIPQYNLGYIEHEKYFEKFESSNRGIFLSGNYRGGISVGDCVKNSDIVRIDGVQVNSHNKFIYVLFNKPEDCISTTNDDLSRRSIFDIVKIPVERHPLNRI